MKREQRRVIRLGLWCLLAVFMLTGCASLKKNQDQAKKLRGLGEAYLMEGNLPQAYSQLEKARQMNPKDPHVYYDLGLFFYQKGEYDRAVRNYEKALKLKPDFATAINNLGVVYMSQQKWQQAIDTLQPITENFAYATPHFPHYLIGQAYFHLGQYDQAISHLQEALSLQPTYVFARFWLGRLYRHSGVTDKAIDSLEKAVEQVPQFAAFHLELGLAYEAAGFFQKAKSAFAQAASLAPNEDMKNEALELKQQMERRAG